MTDIRVQPEGTISVLYGDSAEGRDWLAENLAGDAVRCEPPATQVAQGSSSIRWQQKSQTPPSSWFLSAHSWGPHGYVVEHRYVDVQAVLGRALQDRIGVEPDSDVPIVASARLPRRAS